MALVAPPTKEVNAPDATRWEAAWTRRRGQLAYWLSVPALAVLAYLPVLRIGWLSDDFILLATARATDVNLGVFVPSPIDPIIYRPVSAILTWQLGWLLWGTNPLPYHIIGLLLHAAVCAALTGWLRAATGRRDSVGWPAHCSRCCRCTCKR